MSRDWLGLAVPIMAPRYLSLSFGIQEFKLVGKNGMIIWLIRGVFLLHFPNLLSAKHHEAENGMNIIVDLPYLGMFNCNTKWEEVSG